MAQYPGHAAGDVGEEIVEIERDDPALETVHRFALGQRFREPAQRRQLADRQRVQRRKCDADARVQPAHPLGAMAAQIGRRILAGEKRCEVGLGAQVHVEGARRLVPLEQGHGETPRAAGRLHDRAAGVGIAATPELHERRQQQVEAGSTDERVGMRQHIVGLGERAQRQRLAQRQRRSRLVEKAAHERRADVTGMKDEMHRSGALQPARRVDNRSRRNIGAGEVGPEDAIVEEAGGEVLRPAESHEQHSVAHEIELLRIDVRRPRQSRQQVARDRIGRFQAHDEWY